MYIQVEDVKVPPIANGHASTRDAATVPITLPIEFDATTIEPSPSDRSGTLPNLGSRWVNIHGSRKTHPGVVATVVGHSEKDDEPIIHIRRDGGTRETSYRLRVFVKTFAPEGTPLPAKRRLMPAEEAQAMTSIALPTSLVARIQALANAYEARVRETVKIHARVGFVEVIESLVEEGEKGRDWE
jgi:hypothetical protein